MIETQECPHADRVYRTEKNIELLTKDVDRLVKVQTDFVKIQTEQTAQAVEHRHTVEALKRAFNRIESAEQDAKEIKKSIQYVRERIIELSDRAELIGKVARYWPILAWLAAITYAAYVITKQNIGL